MEEEELYVGGKEVIPSITEVHEAPLKTLCHSLEANPTGTSLDAASPTTRDTAWAAKMLRTTRRTSPSTRLPHVQAAETGREEAPPSQERGRR